jgi:prepilin-type N-terminal cleavage/methylation domain-containing protein
MNNFLKFKNNNQGFTLIEVLVATAVFTIIMLAALGSLLVASNYAKKTKALRAAMDNVNYAMESMSRSLRTGSDYNCSVGINLPSSGLSDCSGGSEIAFKPAYHSTEDTKFYLNTLTTPFTLQKCTSTNGCTDMTSPEVNIKNLRFVVRGTDAFDGIQPSVYILMKGQVTTNGKTTDFALQTLASQRNGE